jgi:hypothetical protein
MPKATEKNTTPNESRPDPIFAAIENHKKLDRTFFDLCRAQEAGLVMQRDVDRSADEADEAAWKMARIKLTTAAGASELPTYIATGPVTDLFELGEAAWHETAFRTVTASLAKITQRAA